MSAVSPSFALPLGLAGFGVDVTWHGPGDVAALATRFGPYARELGSPVDRVVRLTVHAAGTPLPDPPPDVTWPGCVADRTPAGVVTFRRRDLRLTWDARAGVATAHVEAGAVDAAAALDTPLRLLLSALLPAHDGLLLHAAGYADARGAVAFAGLSGAGKTTTARKLAAAGVLSDDQVAVRRTAAGWHAWALPFVGAYAQATRPQVAPLRAVFLLAKRPGPTRTVPLPRARAVTQLLACVPYFVRDDPAAAAVLDHAIALTTTVPVAALELARDAPIEPVLAETLGTP